MIIDYKSNTCDICVICDTCGILEQKYELSILLDFDGFAALSLSLQVLILVDLQV